MFDTVKLLAFKQSIVKWYINECDVTLSECRIAELMQTSTLLRSDAYFLIAVIFVSCLFCY